MEAARSISRSRHRAARHLARGLGLCALTATLLALPGSPASGAVAGEPAVVVDGPGGAQMVFGGEEIESAYDVAPHTATLRGNAGEAGESTGVPKSLSAEGLIALSGSEPALAGYITVPRPNGTVAYLRLAELPGPPEGPASFWVDSGCIRFFRPAIGDGPNAEDNIASCGAPLAIGVRDGAILTVRATPSTAAATAGQAIDFTATAEGGEGGEGFSYVWDFGDGSTAEGPTVGHAFAATGSYRVRVTATGNEESGGESAPVTIVVGSPAAGAGVGAGPEAPKKKTKPHGTGGRKGSGGNGGGRGAKGGGPKNGGKAAGKGSKGGDGKGSGSGSSKGGGAGSHPAGEPGKASEPAQSQPAGATSESLPTELPPIETLPSQVSPFAEAPLPALPPIPTPPPEATVPPPPATGAAPANPAAPAPGEATAAGQTVRGQLVADRFEAGVPEWGAGGSSADAGTQSFASAPPASGDSIPVTALIAAVLLAAGVLFEWRRRPGRGLR
jgi:hypothetical protein